MFINVSLLLKNFNKSFFFTWAKPRHITHPAGHLHMWMKRRTATLQHVTFSSAIYGMTSLFRLRTRSNMSMFINLGHIEVRLFQSCGPTALTGSRTTSWLYVSTSLWVIYFQRSKRSVMLWRLDMQCCPVPGDFWRDWWNDKHGVRRTTSQLNSLCLFLFDRLYLSARPSQSRTFFPFYSSREICSGFIAPDHWWILFPVVPV